MNELKNVIVVPDKGIVIINGEQKEMISEFCLEYCEGKWVLKLEECKMYRASAPGWN